MQGFVNVGGTQLTIELKVRANVNILPPSSFTYTISLFNKLYDESSSLTYIILPVAVASKMLIITCQGTHCEFKKLITSTNVSCPNLDIHKSNEHVVVTQDFKARIT
jgi:hypothetical protein